jgi:YVTN family beta-propeller protein
MLDTSTYKVHGVVPTGMEPAHIILSPDGKTAYATNGSDNTVSVIDVYSMTNVATIPIGEYPHGLRPSPDGR